MTLRHYRDALRDQWRVIVGVTLACTLLVTAVVLTTQSVFSAETTAIITQPGFIVSLDESIDALPEPLDARLITSAYQALPVIARSDDVLSAAHRSDAIPPEMALPLREFRQRVSARLDANGSVVRLSVWGYDPEEAATLANAWMSVFAERANQLYDNTRAWDTQFDTLLDEARTAREEAEARLLFFRADDRRPEINAQLDAVRVAYYAYTTDLQNIERLLIDLDSFEAQLARLPDAAPLSIEQRLTGLTLATNVQAFQTQQPLDLQIALELTGDEGDVLTVADMRETLADLRQSLTTRRDNATARQTELAADLLTLQVEADEIQMIFSDVQQELDLARQAYDATAAQVAENRIRQQVTPDFLQVASQALPPVEPSTPRKAIIIGLAGVVGLALGIALAFIRAYLDTIRYAQPAP